MFNGGKKKSFPNIQPSPQSFIKTCKGFRYTNFQRDEKIQESLNEIQFRKLILLIHN